MGNTESAPQVYSVEVPGTAAPGHGAIRRNPEFAERLLNIDDARYPTLWDLWRRSAERFADNNCLGTRAVLSDGTRGDYVWQTYRTVHERVVNFSAGLARLGLVAPQPVGIYAINRPEWIVCEYASYSRTLPVISLYDTLGTDAAAHIINQAEITVVVATRDKLSKLAELRQAAGCKVLTRVVQMESERDPALVELCQRAELQLLTFAEVEEMGAAELAKGGEAAAAVAAVPPAHSDLATIMYTSGTTGMPKGVRLSHANVMVDLEAILRFSVQMLESDVHLSYLPLAHIFERTVDAGLISAGGSVGFYQGDIQKLMDDVLALRPTLFPSVPRLFNRLYDKVQHGVQSAGGLKKMLFDWGFDAKRQYLEQGAAPTHRLWDNLVFAKIRERLGGRVRLIVSGSAPITGEVQRFLQVCFSCPVLQGYGMTETACATTIQDPSCMRTNHVGGPLICNEIKLVDCPDMKYFSTSTPPRGEICFRGGNVMQGYHKEPEKTAEVLDADGWLHSGDIGQWNEDGTLSIIDRKKNIFKLSQGEYVAAEYLEGVLKKASGVAQIFVYGDSSQSVLVAVVVPDPEVLTHWAASPDAPAGLAGLDFAQLCANELVRAHLLDVLTATGKLYKLKGFEFVKAIHVDHVAFSPENDLITPTYKNKRPQLRTHYQAQIDAMYAALPQA